MTLIEKQFEVVLNSVQKNLPIPFLQTDLDTFYGLYKQISYGDAALTEPAMLGKVEKIKWQAYAENRGKDKREAMQDYVELFMNIASDYIVKGIGRSKDIEMVEAILDQIDNLVGDDDEDDNAALDLDSSNTETKRAIKIPKVLSMRSMKDISDLMYKPQHIQGSSEEESGRGKKGKKEKSQSTDIERRFKIASTVIKDVKDFPLKFTVEQKMQFYGLYKQVMSGDNNLESPPSDDNPLEFYKYKAWADQRGKGKTNAMRDYVDELMNIVNEQLHVSDLQGKSRLFAHQFLSEMDGFEAETDVTKVISEDIDITDPQKRLTSAERPKVEPPFDWHATAKAFTSPPLVVKKTPAAPPEDLVLALYDSQEQQKVEADRQMNEGLSNNINSLNILQDSSTAWNIMNEKEKDGGFLSGMPLLTVVTNAISMLQHKKILWMAPKDGETKHVQLIKNFFSRVSSSFECTIMYVESPQEAIELIKTSKYSIIISNYGDALQNNEGVLNKINDKKQRKQLQESKTRATPAVISILKFLRHLEWNDERLCPVIVYAEESRESGRGMFNRRRKQLLAMGAHDYCIHITDLIKSIYRILKPIR